MHRLDLDLYSHPKEFLGNGVRTHVNSMGKNPLHRRLRGGLNPQRCITQGSEPNTLPTEQFRPQSLLITLFLFVFLFIMFVGTLNSSLSYKAQLFNWVINIFVNIYALLKLGTILVLRPYGLFYTPEKRFAQ